VPLAEELSLTTAELSFLPDRRQAYENLANRTGLDGVKAVSLALIQSERYGTPLGKTLRVMAQEKPRHAHVGGREEGRLFAAEADRADDPVLPAGAVRRHSRRLRPARCQPCGSLGSGARACTGVALALGLAPPVFSISQLLGWLTLRFR
jgi:hypothetical protein